jgi:site-specific recombinase XerD
MTETPDTGNKPDDSTDNEPEIDGTTPSEALQLYLDTREGEVSEQTLKAHRYRLRHFIRWADEHDIETMAELGGKNLHEYRLWRREDGDLNTVSLHTQLSTLRVFLKFCASIEIVDGGLPEKLVIPTLKNGQEQRDSILAPDHATNALSYLERYEYASPDHVTLLLLWQTGMRVGALQSLDVDDYNRTKGQLHIRHRPQGGTSLKLGDDGERINALSSETCVVLNDYLENTRPDVTDEHDRKPLIVFSDTRPAKSTIREHVHRCTQPCLWQNECPHDRAMDECPDIGLGSPMAGCPSSVPPHDVRRGSITHWLTEDVPKAVVSDRMNVNEDILDKHYDQRTEETRAEQRRKFLDDVE